VGAGLQTLTATDASFLPEDEFYRDRSALGVVTPPAVQGAPLKKDRRADARPIVDGILLDIEDYAFCHW